MRPMRHPWGLGFTKPSDEPCAGAFWGGWGCALGLWMQRMILGVLICAGGELLACRYSVRDTGFVDLGEEAYRLVMRGDWSAEKAERLRTLARVRLSDSNLSVVPEVVHRVGGGSSEPVLVLADGRGRKFELARGDVLRGEDSALASILEAAADSALRSEILDAALGAYAVVVLFEGVREAENQMVGVALQGAVRKIERLMPSMPKPVNTPPAVIRVTRARQANERVALWGLGFEVGSMDEPRVAVVFGRGRRIGSGLEGPLITQTAVHERLSIIGQDCECELDRAWMKGPVLPGRWDSTRQNLAARTLGFDPENPLVRTEISRIVNREAGTGSQRKLPKSTTSLGYEENALEDLQSTDGAVAGAENEAGGTNGVSMGAGAVVVGGTVAPGPVVEPAVGGGGYGFTWVMGGAGTLVLLGVFGWWWVRVRKEQG